MKKCQIGKLLLLAGLCAGPSGFAHAHGWSNIGAARSLPVEVTSESAQTIAETGVFIHYAPHCVGNGLPYTFGGGNAYQVPAGTSMAYLSVVEGSALAGQLCPVFRRPGSASFMYVTSGPVGATVSGCADVTCTGPGVVDTVTSTLAIHFD